MIENRKYIGCGKRQISEGMDSCRSLIDFIRLLAFLAITMKYLKKV